jgi:hypothetical protein
MKYTFKNDSLKLKVVVVFVHADGIMGSSPAQGTDVCPRLSVLCCPVDVEAQRRADFPSKESYSLPN